MRAEAVLFDFDWTLVTFDHHAALKEGCRAAYKKAFGGFDDGKFEELLKETEDTAAEQLKRGQYDRTEWFRNAFSSWAERQEESELEEERSGDTQDGAQAYEKLVEWATDAKDSYWRSVESTTDSVRGALRAVHSLAERGFKVAIVAGSDGPDRRREKHKRIEDFLQGLSETVGIFVCGKGGDIPSPKTKSRTYREVCKKLSVDPRRTIMVGDKFDEDIEPARKAGLVAKLKARRGKPPRYDGDTACICSLWDLIDVRELSQGERLELEHRRNRYSETLELFRKKLGQLVYANSILISACALAPRASEELRVGISSVGTMLAILYLLSMLRTYQLHYRHKRALALVDVEHSTAECMCDTYRLEYPGSGWRHMPARVWSGFALELSIPMLIIAIWLLVASPLPWLLSDGVAHFW